jgi:trk system potassium uptake protein TrkA
MAQFVVIGLSAFGQVLAGKLYALGEHVLVLDLDKEKIQQIKDNVSQAVMADAADRKILEKLIKETNATAIVSLGDRLEQSVMVTYHLKEMGVKRIIAKANSGDQGKVLQLVGAHEVIYPERDMALQMAERLSNPSLLGTFSLSKDYAIIEFTVFAKFVGKSLAELKLRNTYNINVLLVKQNANGEAKVLVPPPDYVFTASDTIVALGNKKDLNNLPFEAVK